MNVLNVGMAFAPGINELPYITIVDKGMSSANTIEVLRSMLPEGKKHYAASIRLRNPAEYANIIFDTQLGLNTHTERELDFPIKLISTLCTNIASEVSVFICYVIAEA